MRLVRCGAVDVVAMGLLIDVIVYCCVLPHGYLLPQGVAVIVVRSLAQRDKWGCHTSSLGAAGLGWVVSKQECFWRGVSAAPTPLVWRGPHFAGGGPCCC